MAVNSRRVLSTSDQLCFAPWMRASSSKSCCPGRPLLLVFIALSTILNTTVTYGETDPETIRNRIKFYTELLDSIEYTAMLDSGIDDVERIKKFVEGRGTYDPNAETESQLHVIRQGTKFSVQRNQPGFDVNNASNGEIMYTYVPANRYGEVDGASFPNGSIKRVAEIVPNITIQRLLANYDVQQWLDAPGEFTVFVESESENEVVIRLGRTHSLEGQHEWQLFVDKSKDFTVYRQVLRDMESDRPLQEYESTVFREIPIDGDQSIWLPVSAVYKHYWVDDSIESPVLFNTFEIDTLVVNEEYPDETFMIEFPHGTLVEDKISGSSLTIGKIANMEELIRGATKESSLGATLDSQEGSVQITHEQAIISEVGDPNSAIESTGDVAQNPLGLSKIFVFGAVSISMSLLMAGLLWVRLHSKS